MSPGSDAGISSGFGGLGLIDELAASVSALGYEEPTPVQRETIPLMIARRDVLGQAATGTGKTAAFALPMLQRLAGDDAPARKPTRKGTPKSREQALYEVRRRARLLPTPQRHIKTPPRDRIAGEKAAAGKLPRVRQIAYIVPRAHKPAALDRVLDMENPTSAL